MEIKNIFCLVIIFFLCITSLKLNIKEIFNLETANHKKVVIYLNPGHGKGGIATLESSRPDKSTPKKAGSTGGTASQYAKDSEGNAIPEYEAVYEISTMLQEKLEKAGYIVVMCKQDAKTNMSNQARTKKANKLKVDLHISIHMNGSTSSEANGAFVCLPVVMSKGPNETIVKSSKEYAKAIMDEYIKSTKLNRGTDIVSSNYTTLNFATVPTFIIELGYMSNKNNDLFMQSEEGRKKMVEGIVNGIKKSLPLEKDLGGIIK